MVGAAPAGFGFGDVVTSVQATSSDETYETYCEKVESVLSTMPNYTAKLINAYPPQTYGRAGTTVSMLYKGANNYATLFNVGSADISFSGWRMFKAGGVWYPFEWVNPPMQLGVEYRTTERFMSRPVYTKLIDCGQLSDGKIVNHGIENYQYTVRYQGYRYYQAMPFIYNKNLDDSWSSYVVAVSTTQVQFACGTSSAGGTCQVQLWYTKTTD